MEPTLERRGAIRSVDVGEGQGASRGRERTRFGLVAPSGSGQPAESGEACIGWEGLDPERPPSCSRWKETAGVERTTRPLGGPVGCSGP